MNFSFASIFVLLTCAFIKCEKLQQVPIGKISKQINISHTKVIYALIELPNNILVSGSDDNTIKFWDLNNSRLIKTICDPSQKNKTGYHKIRQLKNGNLVASTFQQNSFIIDFKSKQIIEKLERFYSGFSLFDINSNGDLVSYTQTIGVGSQIFIWKNDLKSIKVKSQFKIKSELHFLGFYNQDQILIVLLDYKVQIYNMNGSLAKTFKIQEDSSSFCLLSDSRMALGYKYSIQIWDINNEKMLFTLSGHKWNIYAIIYLENGDLVSSSGDDTIKVWDLKNKKTKMSIKVEYSPSSLYVLRNGNVIGGTYSGRLFTWDLKTGKLIQSLNGNNENISDVKALLSKIDSRYHEDIFKKWNQTVPYGGESKNEVYNCENKVYFSISMFQTDQAYLNKTIEIGLLSSKIETKGNSKGFFGKIKSLFDKEKCDLIN